MRQATRYMRVLALLIALECLSLGDTAPIGEHPDHVGCVRVTIIKRPLATTTTTTTTTAATTTTTTRATTVATG